MSDTLKRTPLYDLHLRAGARMVPFAGWEMPVQYTGLSAEHQAVRTGAGVFDISHMGKFLIQGTGSTGQLQKLVPSNLAKLAPAQALYTLLLDEQAGIIDDVIFYCRGQDRWVVIVNGATTDKDRTWLESQLTNIQFEDHSLDRALLAIQGPQAAVALQEFVSDDLQTLPRFGHLETAVLGGAALIARTGYTGEDGFEVMVDAEAGRQLWLALVGCGVTACGLGARDTLRLEAAMHLYGQDMDETVTPLEASLGWVIDWSKEAFVGHERLRTQKRIGVEKRLIGFEVCSRQIARHGYPIYADGEVVGIVTSGTLPPTINRPIGLGYVPVALCQPGTAIEVEIRGKLVPAVVVKRPFYRHS